MIALPLRRSLAVLALLSLVACGQSDGERVTDLDGDETARGAMLAGVVTDTEGRPSEGAVVTLEAVVDGLPASVAAQLPGADPALARAGADFATTTDSRGHYRLPGVGAGDWQLEARAANHLGHSSRFALGAAAVAAGDTIIVDVALTPVASYTGVATLENATSHQATLVNVEGSSHVAVTDPAGAWRIDGVPLGSHDLRASHIGYLDETYQGQLSAAGQVEDLGSVVLPLDANIAPVAEAAGPYLGFQQVLIQFSGSGSDLDGNVVYYEWDFEGDGVWDWSDSTTGSVSHAYPAVGNYLAKLRVTDDKGAHGLDVASVAVTTNAVYLAYDGNNSDPGTPQLPVRTLAHALQLAASQQLDQIFVAEGVYAGSGSTTLLDGVSIAGGRDRITWAESASGLSRFVGAGRELFGATISAATLVRRVAVEQTSPPASGPSSALRLANCLNTLQFEECAFTAAAGRVGSAGAPGQAGPNGGSGSTGQPGNCDGNAGQGGSGGSSSIGCPGGSGGAGGFPGANAGAQGSGGACSGGAGGSGGSGGDPGIGGNGGQSGGSGSLGSNGSVGSDLGNFSGSSWSPSNAFAGGNGTNGRGGGGGGGGGGQGCTFCNNGGGNGGGGGGGGGARGTAGQGGQGGWGSFAALLVNSPVSFVDCSFNSADGGNGGAGGNGGRGGLGGPGGFGATNCLSEIGRGGNGGSGGNGGDGGGGGGAAGGPSYGIYHDGVLPTLSGSSFSVGNGGAGGSGGLRGGVGPAAPSGPAGSSGNIN